MHTESTNGMNTRPEHDWRFHGRRKSRPLKPRQRRLMETLLPKVSLRDVPPKRLRRPQELFSSAVERMVLEIGFGGGEHLAQRAREHPDWGFIGAEPFVNGIAKMLVAVEEHHLDNVRIWPDDARKLLPLLGDETLAEVWLLYPDPWPKTRHHKRRFVNPENLTQIHRILQPGGLFFFASDIADYVRWTLLQVRRHGGFVWLAARAEDWRTPPAGWPGTRYEQKALRAGRRPTYLLFRKK